MRNLNKSLGYTLIAGSSRRNAPGMGACIWRYVIRRRGTDLSSLGLSLIFDNAATGHFSLIPNEWNAPGDGI
jgi:hypothetical protein